MITTCGKPQKKNLQKSYALGVSPGDEQLISRYLTSLESENASTRSVRLKRWQLQSLAKSTPLTEVDEDALVDFINRPQWGPDARKSARSTIRGFYAWAHRKGLVSHNPAMYLRSVRVPAGRPRPVPEGIVAKALNNCDNNEQRLMVLLAAYAGLRVSEIAGLRTDALTSYGLHVTGKGGKHRIVPVHPVVAGPLTDHVRGSTSPWVFPSPVDDHHVRYDYIYKRIKAALGDDFTPHQLRHRFATQAYKGSHDLRAVQELLGHSSPNTTVRYTLIEDDALAAAVAAVGAPPPAA